MATVIGVGMQMTANASGMTKGLSEADRALQLLQKIVDQNQQSMKRFAGEAEKTGQSVEKLTRDVGVLSKIEIGRAIIDGFQAIGSAFSSAAQNVLSLAGNVSQSLDSLNDLSARTGIGVESLQGYALAAKMAGVDTEAFGVAVQKLAVNIGKAAPGDALDKSLKEINLSVEQLRTLSPEQQFTQIGDAIGRLPTVADRAAAAVQIFGKQGAALGPLFREGAASIEELRERAERLGIIVSETQINNVADMNDAFDLVRATVEGIIGQVVGNLAPAVTDVTNQFLRFVEEWSGAQGEGGTGIANAITDVLLQGAEIFAGVFDRFVADFGGFTDAISAAGAIFQSVGNAFFAVTESLRQVFNLFELVGNGITLGIGKLLEAVGDWISDDLKNFGSDLANSASQELAKNQKEFLDAGANAFESGLNAVGLGEGETVAAARGEGAATAYVQKFRQTVEASQAPELKVATNIEDVRERLLSFLDNAGEGASDFLQQSEKTLEVFQSQVEQGELTATQIEIMTGFAERLNAELDKETALRREAAEAATAQATADGKRVDSLLTTSDAASKLQQDLDAVERERQRVQEQTGADADARLAQLDALKGRLEDQQQALEQGFGQGFGQAFAQVDQTISGLVDKSREFGQAGFNAALQLQQGIAAAQQQAANGILNKEAFDREVQRQQDLFQQELKNIDEAAKAKEAAAAKAADLEKQRRAEALDAEKARVEEQLRIQQEVATQQQRAQEEVARAQQQAQQEYLQEIERQREEQAKAFEAEAKRQEQRLAALNTVGQQSVRVGDIRTAEGASLVVDLAAQAQDPSLIQERQQTKLLQQIALSLAGAAANYFNQPVAIVGEARLG